MTLLRLLLFVLVFSAPIGLAHASAVYEITLASLELAQEKLENGDPDGASTHIAFASAFFANNRDPGDHAEASDLIHLNLLDADTFGSNNDTDRARDSVESALGLLHGIEIDNRPADYVEMLAVAEKHYRESIIYDNETSFDTADRIVRNIGERVPDERIGELGATMQTRTGDYRHVADMVAYIQRTVFGATTVEVNDAHLYLTIRTLYDSVIDHVERGNYDAAGESAIEAYLDNFEYLEPSIAAVDEQLMLSLEVVMREELRELIADGAPADDIRAHIIDNILPDLARAEEIAAQAAPQTVIASTLAEPGRSTARMGSAADEQKEAVRAEVDDIRAKLQLSTAAHAAGDYQASYEHARSAYLDSYELIEIPLRVISPDFTLEVETEFAELRNVVRGPASADEVREAVLKIERSIDESERLVSGTGEIAPLIAFSSSFAIIFREGLESVLILGAIMTYLEASRNTRFKPHLMYGVLAGIGATGVTWIVAQYIIEISGASREYIEAIAALSATAVLFYVSFWVLNKIEHRKWMEFVKAKVWQATTTGSATVFVMLSFFTVYREGFESVLFYQALFSFARYSELFVILGMVLGLGSLLVIYFVMRRLGHKLPLRALFGLTMGVGAYLSIAFLGNAVRELQLLDILPYTSMLGTIPRLDVSIATLTGIYPTLETTVAQIVLLSVYLAASSYVLVLRPRRIARLAAMRKSVGDAR